METVEVALIGGASRDQELLLPVKRQFLLRDAERLACDFTEDSPVDDIIGDIVAAIGE